MVGKKNFKQRKVGKGKSEIVMNQEELSYIMTSRRVTPLLLAASIALTGATGAFIGSMTPAQAITSVDELTDVNQNHWAYEALRDLVEKYDVIEGYPDHTFRGERAATRWELAAALNALIKSVGRDLARLGAEKADKSDLEALARLQEEFRNELAALKARTDALETRAAAIEAKNAEQDQRLTLLERTQLHGDASIGILSDIGANGTSTGGGGNDGILDGISAIGRLRLTMDVPVKEDREDSKVGAGEVHTRLIAAFGRFAPSGGAGGNAGAFDPFSGYSRIGTDASTFNEGISSGDPSSYGGVITNGTNTRLNLYVENLHYHQHFKSGIPLLTDWMMGSGTDDANWATTGDLYVGIAPWRYLFDKSPYRGNELTQFQNTSFVNTPGVLVNQNIPILAYQWHQMLGSDDLSMDLTAAVGSPNVGDMMDGFLASYEARLNFDALLGLPGSVYAGGYHVWGLGNTLNFQAATAGLTNRSGISYTGAETYNTRRETTNGFYAGWNQEWYNGIGTTINYALNTGGATNLIWTSFNQNLGAFAANDRAGSAIAVAPRQSISGVLNIPMKVFGMRENDALGIGYGIIDLHEEMIGEAGSTIPTEGDKVEHVAEVYYRWQVNDSISIVPSYQFIGNRLGVDANDVSHVIGLRTNFQF